MHGASPILIWLRRDLRLSDHPAFEAACRAGRPVIPVYICDSQTEILGAAPKFRLGLGLQHFADHLNSNGSRLILRRNASAQDALLELIAQTGAGAVYWSRQYDPDAIARDTLIKTALKERGIEARSFAAHLLFEPWTVQTKTGGFYKVFTPFWNSVKGRDVPAPLPAPTNIPSPEVWPASDTLADWQLGAAMGRGAAVVQPHCRVGEAAAQSRLQHFCGNAIAAYQANRDLPAVDGTSNLSENLALGEISPQQCWHAGLRAMHEGKAGAETFLKEIVWREFAYHLMHHTPHILTSSWRPAWDGFDWNTDPDTPAVHAWQQGRTGVPFVDAAMRELYVTGRMHNRGRMIVASYLTKHLLCHWRIGQQWFADTLCDWDPASNAMGWQWAAGSGPDASPYFRVFNPETQLDKFDKARLYANRWIAEGQHPPHEDACAYYAAIPKRWNLTAQDAYPAPIVDLAEGRHRALDAYQNKAF
ncbi:MAG: deoxyribodipyrimidine photo-lyase [Sulfitobacter sp.]